MNPARRKLRFYWAVVALYVAIYLWWLVYFSRMDSILLHRVQRAGAQLDPAQVEALRTATGSMARMFMFEGGFLGLLLLASAGLVVRALIRELAVHRQQRNFLSAVTHELKSPIASASLYIETLQLGRAKDDEQRARYLQHAKEDLRRLQDMVDQLLESARLSRAGPDIHPENIDLSELTARCLLELEQEGACRGATVTLEAPVPVAVRADPHAIQTILRNLISNAVKYGGEEPRIVVRVSKDEGGARLKVRDYGPGIGGANRKQIMGAFVRGGNENVRTQKGVGLGLFMVAELSRAMGGSARVAPSMPGAGFAVEVDLPASTRPL